MKLNFRAIDFDKVVVEFGTKYTGEELRLNRVPMHGWFRYPKQSDTPSRLRESLTCWRDDRILEEPSYESNVKLVKLLEVKCKAWMQQNPDLLKQAGLDRLQSRVDSAKSQLMELAQQAADKETEIDKLQAEITLRS